MQTHILKEKRIQILLAAGVFLIALGLFLTYSQRVLGVVSRDDPQAGRESFQHFNFFASSTADTFYFSTTTTATSTSITPYFDSNGRKDNGYFVIAGAKKVTVYFGRDESAGGDGSSTFFVEVTRDGSNWVSFNKLISNVTNSNAQTLTRVGSVALTSTTTDAYSLDIANDAFYGVRCKVVELTDGAHACSASAQW